jgi:acyl dehydratase
MTIFWREPEIAKAKADERVRNKIKTEIETEVEIGKPRFYSVQSEDHWYKIRNQVATADAIRQYCDAIGDTNPLYRDPDYARNSILRGLTAPPYFLCTVSLFTWKGVVDMSKYSYLIAGFDMETEVEWFKIIRQNDEFIVYEIATEVIDLTREDTPLRFLVCADKIYKNQEDEIVAIVKTKVMKMIISPEKRGQLDSPEVRHFSKEEVENWFALINKEEVRGSTARFWEDVNVGDQLQPTHHVFTVTESAAFLGACRIVNSWRYEMVKFGNDMWKSKLDTESGLPDLSGLHLTDSGAQIMGSPRAVCLFGQMQAWLCRMITNWMGDAGFLKKLSCQIRRPLYRESLALCNGKVARKYIEGQEHLVELDIAIQDHNGDSPIQNARATVILPSHGSTYIEKARL